MFYILEVITSWNVAELIGGFNSFLSMSTLTEVLSPAASSQLLPAFSVIFSNATFALLAGKLSKY